MNVEERRAVICMCSNNGTLSGFSINRWTISASWKANQRQIAAGVEFPNCTTSSCVSKVPGTPGGYIVCRRPLGSHPDILWGAPVTPLFVYGAYVAVFPHGA